MWRYSWPHAWLVLPQFLYRSPEIFHAFCIFSFFLFDLYLTCALYLFFVGLHWLLVFVIFVLGDVGIVLSLLFFPVSDICISINIDDDGDDDNVDDDGIGDNNDDRDVTVTHCCNEVPWGSSFPFSVIQDNPVAMKFDVKKG
ncbi:unnamed protein product [Gongylonema pulchrum]|uniref:Uncharacterized protein n=1 Tax=Gongylonema pulchrum TaxID=637853 RepID=A0A3P6Q7T9_9BILA|nr:unnamed protein product [Gongylonema pulchrum]